MQPPAKGLRAYTLRDFVPGDLGEVTRLVCDTVDACYRGVYPQEAIEHFKEYHSEAHVLEDAASGCTLVLEADQHLVATGTLLGDNVRRVFVHPSYQHQGFGRLVMRTLEQRARAQDVAAVDLASSLVSKPFYDRLGYTTEREDYVPVRNGKRLVYYAMVKTLDGLLQIVRADSQDRLAELRALCEQYAASLDFKLDFQDFEDEMGTLPGDYRPPWGRLLLAIRQGEAAGCVALRPLEDRICEMKRLFVRPACRRSGIGRELAQEAVDEARRIGYQRVRLDTAPHMKEAQALYRSLGFRSIAPYYHNPIPGAVYLELSLDRSGPGADSLDRSRRQDV